MKWLGHNLQQPVRVQLTKEGEIMLNWYRAGHPGHLTLSRDGRAAHLMFVPDTPWLEALLSTLITIFDSQMLQEPATYFQDGVLWVPAELPTSAIPYTGDNGTTQRGGDHLPPGT